MITGKDLIARGYTPGKWFGNAIAEANERLDRGASEDKAWEAIAFHNFHANPVYEQLPLDPVDNDKPLHINLDQSDPGFVDNVVTMRELLRVPTVTAGALMPDACHAGTIPVGGVVLAKNAIHPGFHSADICCSVAMADLGFADPKEVLDRAMEVTHFGPGGRQQRDQHKPSRAVEMWFEMNRFLKWFLEPMQSHFATSGDGNHFLYVGRLRSSGHTVVVTHHGSRKPGAILFKAGMQVAEDWRRKLSPETPPAAAWIPWDSQDGADYWDALQGIREWTRESHFKIHQLLGFPIHDWRWNEHNFVFRLDDETFAHAKGATPGWMPGLVPLNMGAPILLTEGTGAANGLNFLPHGAGRHYSRTRYLRDHDDGLETSVDVRWFSGIPDRSELPGAYKSADTIRSEISRFNLATIVDEIEPYGSIMAGDWQAKYRTKK